MNPTDVRESGLIATFLTPDDAMTTHPGVLAIGGSDGGIPENLARWVARAGFAVLAVTYHGMTGLPPEFIEVPIDPVRQALRWLDARADVTSVDPGRWPVVGYSRGAELALMVATIWPERVGPVVAYTPSSVRWEGFSMARGGRAFASSWSLEGRPLPYLASRPDVNPTFSDRGMSLLPVFDDALDQADEIVAEAAIPVERATGPLLLVSGGHDRMWPAARMSEQIVERMTRHGRSGDVVHITFPDAGHRVVPPMDPPVPPSQPGTFEFDRGGSPDADLAAHNAVWPRVLAHLHQDPRPADGDDERPRCD